VAGGITLLYLLLMGAWFADRESAFADRLDGFYFAWVGSTSISFGDFAPDETLSGAIDLKGGAYPPICGGLVIGGACGLVLRRVVPRAAAAVRRGGDRRAGGRHRCSAGGEYSAALGSDWIGEKKAGQEAVQETWEALYTVRVRYWTTRWRRWPCRCSSCGRDVCTKAHLHLCGAAYR